jgi:tetratricopeptide (TPR) repeat protein
MQMCFGELEQAKRTYLDLIESSTNNYLAYENLGSVLMFEHDFAGALDYKLRSIELQPDVAIHQVWGSVAEVYLRNENPQLASQHYQKALRIAERDELLDNMSADGRLSKIYYQMKLNRIAPNDFQFDELEAKANSFLQDSSNLGLKSKSHLAWIAGQIGKEKEKQDIWSSISRTCPVYKHSPELIFG